MKQLSIMIKPASSLCNLRCKYCFYADVTDMRDVKSYGVMSAENREVMLKNIENQLEPGDKINFAFQGGEPTVAGLDWFKAFSDITSKWDKKIKVSYALQTNGTLLNDEWCEYLHKNNYLVGLSFDIIPACHNDSRVDTAGKGTYPVLLKAIDLLNRHKVEYNVLCTLTRQVARHPAKVWKVIKDLDIRYTQFTPCLDALDAPGKNPFALTPQRFASFYKELFPLWYEDFKKNEYRSIKLIDDIVNLMAYGVPTACGIHGHCQPQLVVEANGSVYPCDFYCLDEYQIGSILTDTLDDLLKAARTSPAQVREPLPDRCRSCRYIGFCGGNCKRMKAEITVTSDGRYCGYQDILDSIGGDLSVIAQIQKSYR